MISQRFFSHLTLAAAVVSVAAVTSFGAVATAQDKGKRPKLSVRTSQGTSFTGRTVTFTAELKDGDNDFEEYYCASIEWDWADGTKSESEDDCDPYEPGKSEIKRTFIRQHKYTIDGIYDVQFRLKQDGKTVASARTKITIRPGSED